MIIFSDFDHTLYHKDDPILTAANLKAITKWRSKGHQFCIATGRNYESLTSVIPDISALCDFYILDSGSIILDSSRTPIATFVFEPSAIHSIEKTTASLPFDHTLLYYTPDSDSFTPITGQVTKIRLWFDESAEELSRIHARLQGLPAQLFDCKGENNSHHQELKAFNTFIEFIPNYSGKEKAVRTLAARQNIAPTDIITVGDDENDYLMIKEFDGYMIEGSHLHQANSPFKTTPSVAALTQSY